MDTKWLLHGSQNGYHYGVYSHRFAFYPLSKCRAVSVQLGWPIHLTINISEGAGPLNVPENKKRYRIVAISLYSNEATEADRVTNILQEAGWPRANRSLVVREALARLFEDLADKDSEGVFNYFLERRAKRAMGRRDKSA